MASTCVYVPLWQYPHRRLTEPFTLLELDYAGGASEAIESAATVPLVRGGRPHAVVMWVDYVLARGGVVGWSGAACTGVDDGVDVVASTGVRDDAGPVGHYQAVRFLPQHQWAAVDDADLAGAAADIGTVVGPRLDTRARYDAATAQIATEFSVMR